MKSILLGLLIFPFCILFFGCQKDNDPPPPTPPVANAGSDQTIQLPTSATFTLSGSGTTQNGTIASYAWTRVSGPNTPTINNASSATTTVSGFIAGTYVFQLSVTNSSGLSASASVTITVTSASTTTPIANAGIDQTIQLPTGFFVLSGSGTTQNGTITSYSWTLVSGPNVPVINNSGAATTSVSGFIAGTYVFQLTVVNSSGLSANDTVIIVVNPAPTQTLTLQPSNSNNEALIGNTGTDPVAPELVAAAWTSGGNPFNLRGAFKFDLSSIPTTATIISANLTLYSNPTPLNGDQINANSGSNNSMYIRRLTSSWTPASITWVNQPGTSTTDQVLIPHTAVSLLDLTNIDVKSMVSSMVTGANYGFMIGLQNETIFNIRDFCSSRYSDATKHPKLIITYQ